MHENKTIIRTDNLYDDLLPCDTHLRGFTFGPISKVNCQINYSVLKWAWQKIGERGSPKLNWKQSLIKAGPEESE